MAVRKIIEIDEELCNGCGHCITGCAEGALALVDGKARLVKEDFCDGFGDCIGTCPTGALRIVEREAPVYNEEATRQHVLETRGEEALRQMDEAAQRHAVKNPPAPTQTPSSGPPAGGCPGMRMRFAKQEPAAAAAVVGATEGLPDKVLTPELQQWPVQLHLVPPQAPWFKDRELVIMSTCAPVASADVHWRFLRGRSVVIACPKLDRTDPYVDKLTGIFREPSLPRVLVVRMEVPCCGGLTSIAQTAASQCGREDLELQEIVVALDGTVREVRKL